MFLFIILNIVKHCLHVWLIPFHVHSNLLPRFSSGSIIVALTVTTSRGGAGRVVVHLKIRGIYNIFTQEWETILFWKLRKSVYSPSVIVLYVTLFWSVSFQFFCITRYFESVELQSNHGDCVSKVFVDRIILCGAVSDDKTSIRW